MRKIDDEKGNILLSYPKILHGIKAIRFIKIEYPTSFFQRWVILRLFLAKHETLYTQM